MHQSFEIMEEPIPQVTNNLAIAFAAALLTAALESATVASIEVRDFNSKFLLALSV
jgi:hypothetical protein